ncbi:MAG: hypothetical protein JXB26_01370 [Candidatus Aminicenantes bacterium]|nr:hypothetical protein [Candidatus Aminicenantes bacterium]
MGRLRYKEAIGDVAKKGKPPIGKKPSKAELQKLYVENSKSLREVADQLGCTKDMINRALNEYGIKKRPNIKRSKLRSYDKSYLKQEVEEKGITKVAKDFSVDIRTLKKYI